jgi:hypothetical protein
MPSDSRLPTRTAGWYDQAHSENAMTNRDDVQSAPPGPGIIFEVQLICISLLLCLAVRWD